jgi:PAS domain S-box-containing protein
MKISNLLINLTRQENKIFYDSDKIESVSVLNVKDLKISKEINLYQEILEVLPVAVLIHSNGRFVYANQEAAGLHGLEYASQLVGRCLVDFVHPDDVDKFQKIVLDNFESHNKKLHTELRIVQANNMVLDLEITSVPVFFAGKQARLAICTDRTEQKQIRASLINHLVFLETLIDTIPNPVFYKDRKGSYLGCNKIFSQKILGVSRHEIIGKTVYDLPEVISFKDADIYHDYDQKLFEQSGVQIYESKVGCADGIKRDFISLTQG